jgi:hypothetical protein
MRVPNPDIIYLVGRNATLYALCPADDFSHGASGPDG